MQIDVFECDATSRTLVTRSTLAELLRQAAECCSAAEIAEIRQDLESGYRARMACNAGAWIEYEPSAKARGLRNMIIAERLRAAAEFRRAGMLHSALTAICYARSNRLLGRDCGDGNFPRRAEIEDLGDRAWRREHGRYCEARP